MSKPLLLRTYRCKKNSIPYAAELARILLGCKSCSRTTPEPRGRLNLLTQVYRQNRSGKRSATTHNPKPTIEKKRNVQRMLARVALFRCNQARHHRFCLPAVLQGTYRDRPTGTEYTRLMCPMWCLTIILDMSMLGHLRLTLQAPLRLTAAKSVHGPALINGAAQTSRSRRRLDGTSCRHESPRYGGPRQESLVEASGCLALHAFAMPLPSWLRNSTSLSNLRAAS